MVGLAFALIYVFVPMANRPHLVRQQVMFLFLNHVFSCLFVSKTRSNSIWNHQERNYRKNSLFKTRSTIRKYSEHLARFFLHYVVCAVKLPMKLMTGQGVSKWWYFKIFCFLKFNILSIYECWHSDTRHSYIAFLNRIFSTCPR